MTRDVINRTNTRTRFLTLLTPIGDVAFDAIPIGVPEWRRLGNSFVRGLQIYSGHVAGIVVSGTGWIECEHEETARILEQHFCPPVGSA